MPKSEHSRGQDCGSRAFRWTVALLGAALALAPGAALAQEAGGSPDRNVIMIWTAIVSVLALVACAIGYAWRRMEGMDHPTPDELEMMGGHGHGGDDESEHTAAPVHH